MSKKALVADNDFFFVEFLTELLEKRGYEVIKAGDGKEAISKLEKEPVDVLFADLIMPRIDGKQLIKLARKKFSDVPFPIVAVSGVMIEQLDVIDDIGADYYIAKGPLEEMTDCFNGFLDRIENKSYLFPGHEILFKPEHIYPTKITMELIESLDFLRAITESIGIGIIVVDKDARVICSNSFALDLLNKSLEEVLTYPIIDVFPKSEKTRLIDALKRIILNPELKKVDSTFIINNRKIRITVSLLKIDSKVAGWIIALADIGQAAD